MGARRRRRRGTALNCRVPAWPPADTGDGLRAERRRLSVACAASSPAPGQVPIEGLAADTERARHRCLGFSGGHARTQLRGLPSAHIPQPGRSGSRPSRSRAVPSSWLYRHTSKKSTTGDGGYSRIPHRKLEGDVVFVVGEMREWVRHNEDVVQGDQPERSATKRGHLREIPARWTGAH